MDIAKNLRRLRVINGATQENLAKFLGISYQAVSKWERGEGYPDITLLPAIARFFNTTVDELLGTEKEHRDARYKELQDGIQAAIAAGNTAVPPLTGEELEKAKEATADAIRAGIREFPDDYEILLHCAGMMTTLTSDKYKREAIAVYEHILRNCTESRFRTHAETSMCFALTQLGERERALAIADTMPDFFGTKHYIKPLISRGLGEESVRYFQEAISDTLYKLSVPIERLIVAKSGADTDGSGGTYIFTAAERIEMCETYIKLYELLYGGDHPLFAWLQFEACAGALSEAMDAGEYGKALELYERAVEFAIANYNAPSSGTYKGLFANRITFDETDGYRPDAVKAEVRNRKDEELSARKLMPISGDPRFLAAREKLERCAGG